MKRFLLLSLAALFSASAVQASSVNISSAGGLSTEGLGAFTGTVTYDDVSQLTISLTNTTPSAGGFLTGFVFNINGDATATLNPDPTGSFEGVTNESASPFGTFDAGAALGGDFTGGGSPNNGIAVGNTMNFVFDITGNNGFDVSTLTAEDFVSQISSGQGQNPYDAAFVARFKGMANGGSDAVSGTVVHAIPLPSAAWSGLGMLGGLLGLAGLGKLRRTA
jgi:hypothetical protein